MYGDAGQIGLRSTNPGLTSTKVGPCVGHFSPFLHCDPTQLAVSRGRLRDSDDEVARRRAHAQETRHANEGGLDPRAVATCDEAGGRMCCI